MGMVFEKQPWEELLLIIQNFYNANNDTTLHSIRAHVNSEEIVKNNELTFGEARLIDEVVFGDNGNTHWVEAYQFPEENDPVTVDGQACLAHNVGVFTFEPLPVFTATNGPGSEQ